jgi:hypothetical protein
MVALGPGTPAAATKPKCRRAGRISGSGGTADIEPQHHRRFVLHHVTQDGGAGVSEEPERTLLPIALRSSMRRGKINHGVEDCRHWLPGRLLCRIVARPHPS